MQELAELAANIDYILTNSIAFAGLLAYTCIALADDDPGFPGGLPALDDIFYAAAPL
jgi:hypothetical protein